MNGATPSGQRASRTVRAPARAAICTPGASIAKRCCTPRPAVGGTNWLARVGAIVTTESVVTRGDGPEPDTRPPSTSRAVPDRKSVVQGRGGAGGVDIVGLGSSKKKKIERASEKE